MNKRWHSVILCGIVLLLIVGLSAGVVGLAYAGADIVPVSDPVVREQPLILNVDYSAYGSRKEELDPDVLYDRACRQTVYIYWTEKLEDGKENTISGSGFIVSYDGYIMTNAHCVSDALAAGDSMTVELYDGRTFDGKIVGADTQTDVALLKIGANGLSAATLSTGKPKGCQKVYAMGHPKQDLKYTMTCGIISGLDRTIEMEDDSVLKVFQFDAPVNFGNSGGPLYDAYGAVVGIVTAKYMSLDTEGISFAVPIQLAATIAGDLKNYGYVTGRPLMGITSIAVAADNLRPGSPAGVMVYSATEGLAGARAGLKKGDIIVMIDGDTVSSMKDLTRILQKYKAGDTVKLRFWREGEFLSANLTFDEVTPEHPVGPVKIEEDTLDDEEAGEEDDTTDETASGVY